MSGALEGVTVLEIANYVSGPYAAMLLGDLGATVIKIEGPNGGDPFRGWGSVEYSATFGSLNRNKKSVVLDLKNASEVEMLRALIGDADVLIQNFRPGTLERSALGYDDVKELNPRLIYTSITGFGNAGPYRDYPGYDTVGQGMSGLLSLLTEMDDPKPMGISLSDHLAGIFACYGVLAALLARARTGRGQHVETSLLESSIAFLAENAAGFFEGSGKPPSRATRTHQAQVFTFVAADGKPFVVHLSSPPKFWQGLLAAVDAKSLTVDERFSTRPERIKNYDALCSELSAIIRTKPRSAWLDLLRDNDVPCGPLNDFTEVFDDPQVELLQLKHKLPHPKRGSVTVVGSPVRLSDTPVTIVSAAPELGADTERYLGGERFARVIPLRETAPEERSSAEET